MHLRSGSPSQSAALPQFALSSSQSIHGVWARQERSEWTPLWGSLKFSGPGSVLVQRGSQVIRSVEPSTTTPLCAVLPCGCHAVESSGGHGSLTLLTPSVNNEHVILSFACRETERVFRAGLSRRFSPGIQRSARRKLLVLHAATDLRQMSVPPGNRLEALKGDRKGQHSVRINDQWRLCFRWADGNAHEVEITDYH
jgi:toxin HigB-1